MNINCKITLKALILSQKLCHSKSWTHDIKKIQLFVWYNNWGEVTLRLNLTNNTWTANEG